MLVHGASGGVGLAACDLARALGAKVIAASHRQVMIKAPKAIDCADHHILNTGRFCEDVSDLTDGRLGDLVFDQLDDDVFDESTRCVVFAGKLRVVGFVAGRIPQIALIKGSSVVGVRAGEYARRFPDRAARMTEEVDRLAVSGAIPPHIDRTMLLENWRAALEAMERGEIVRKILLEL